MRAIYKLALVFMLGFGGTYLATHTHGEIDRDASWISVDVGPGAFTWFVNRNPGGAVVGNRYDHWEGAVTPLFSVATYRGANAGVAVGVPGGVCAGWEAYGAPGDPGPWASRSEC